MPIKEMTRKSFDAAYVARADQHPASPVGWYWFEPRDSDGQPCPDGQAYCVSKANHRTTDPQSPSLNGVEVGPVIVAWGRDEEQALLALKERWGDDP